MVFSVFWIRIVIIVTLGCVNFDTEIAMLWLDGFNFTWYLFDLFDYFLDLWEFSFIGLLIIGCYCSWSVSQWFCGWREYRFGCMSFYKILLSIGAFIVRFGLGYWPVTIFAIGSISGMWAFTGVEVFHFECFFTWLGSELSQPLSLIVFIDGYFIVSG